MRHHGSCPRPFRYLPKYEVRSFQISGFDKSVFVSKSTRYMFFDTETSGLPRQMDAPIARLDNWPRVIQLAWILTDFQGRVISERQFLVQPGQWRMQPGALRVHGITLSHARQHGRPLAEVLNRFALDLLQTDSVIGHNVQFDQKILGAEFLRVGQTNPLQKRHAQCTMKMGASFLQRHYPEWVHSARSSSARLESTTDNPWASDSSSKGKLELATAVETVGESSTDAADAVAETTAGYRVDPPGKQNVPHRANPSPTVQPSGPVEGATWRDSGTGFRYPSLRRLHRTLFGNDFENAHNALADTQACMNCFFKMCQG